MIKDLAELKALKQKLKSRAEAAIKAEQDRREREREANLFRTTVGEVAPLRTAARVSTPLPRPQPIAHQRLADDEAALQESLSDEFSIDTLLEVDEDLIIPDDSISINEGAIAPWTGSHSSEYFLRLLEALASELKFSLDNPWKKLSIKAKEAIINGFDYEVHVKYKNRYGRVRNYSTGDEGEFREGEEGGGEAGRQDRGDGDDAG